MNENYNLYVQRGKDLLAEKAAAKAEQEKERRAANRQEWLEYLQPILDSIPPDLHEFVTFDDSDGPYADGEAGCATLGYVPCVPIWLRRISGEVRYSVGKVKGIDYTSAGVPHLQYTRLYYATIFEAIAGANAIGGNNGEWEGKLIDAAPAQPATAAPTVTNPLSEARLAIHDGCPEVANAWLLLSIAESLNAISTILDGTICIKDVDKY